MSLKYHFQHIKNKTLKNVVFFTFHGTQNETIIFKNQTITIKEQRFLIVDIAVRKDAQRSGKASTQNVLLL